MFSLSIFNRDEKDVAHFDANYKKVLFAILLSIFPGLGQVYTGKLYRGIIGYLGLIVLSWLCAILFLRIDSRLFSIILLCVPFIYALAVCIDAAFCAIKEANNRVVSNKRILALHIVIFITLFICINSLMDYLVGKHVVRAYFVTTRSMTPNIFQYDMILVDKLSRPSAGDVVLLEFSNSENETSISSVIKDQTLRRIVATEGDTVEFRGKQLYINNALLSEEYAQYGVSDSHNIYTSNDYQWGPEVVPENRYFVLSDSRQYGFDSRTFGFIDKNYIHGKASKVLWSWNLDEGSFQWGRTASRIK